MPSTQYKWLAGERYISKLCMACGWLFHCPVEQHKWRFQCRACESISDG